MYLQGDRNSNQHMEMKLADTGITKAGFKVFATDAKEDFIVEYLSPCLSRWVARSHQPTYVTALLHMQL